MRGIALFPRACPNITHVHLAAQSFTPPALREYMNTRFGRDMLLVIKAEV